MPAIAKIQGGECLSRAAQSRLSYCGLTTSLERLGDELDSSEAFVGSEAQVKTWQCMNVVTREKVCFAERLKISGRKIKVAAA